MRTAQSIFKFAVMEYASKMKSLKVNSFYLKFFACHRHQPLSSLFSFKNSFLKIFLFSGFEPPSSSNISDRSTNCVKTIYSVLNILYCSIGSRYIKIIEN